MRKEKYDQPEKDRIGDKKCPSGMMPPQHGFLPILKSFFMTLPQAKFREAVFYALFSWDFLKTSEEEMVSMLMHELAMSKKNVKEALEKAERIMQQHEIIDEKIREHIHDYHLARISYIERNILRLATYELLFDHSIPEVVAIAEGIRLCRKFGTHEAAHFINGVLDAIYKNQEALKLSPH